MKKRQQGFSLLEVACLIGIIGMVGMMALPSIEQLQQRKAEQFIREMCLDLSVQRTAAQHHPGVPYKVTLKAEEDGKVAGYTLKQEDKIVGQREAAGGIDITVKGIKGSGETAISEMLFELTASKKIEEPYDQFEIIATTDAGEVTAVFTVKTGYYKISQ